VYFILALYAFQGSPAVVGWAFRESAISTLGIERFNGAFPECLAQILGIHQEPLFFGMA
jgi:hypothetical protein